MRLAASSSRATALNRRFPTASQRTDPAKSDVSVPGNAWSMSQDVCPFASRGKLAASRSTPSRIKSHRTNPGLDSRLWTATPVVIPPSWRRTGKRASLTGGAGSHHGLADVGEIKAEHPADGTVRDHRHRSAHQSPSPVGRDREHSQHRPGAYQRAVSRPCTPCAAPPRPGLSRRLASTPRSKLTAPASSIVRP